jgi:hypothetical protein
MTLARNHTKASCTMRQELLHVMSCHSGWLWVGRPRGRNSSPGRVKNFHFSISCPDWLWGPLNPLSKGCWGGGPSPGVKRQRREALLSPPTSAEVKKTWVYTSTPQYPFMASCLSTGTTLTFSLFKQFKWIYIGRKRHSDGYCSFPRTVQGVVTLAQRGAIFLRNRRLHAVSSLQNVCRNF